MDLTSPEVQRLKCSSELNQRSQRGHSAPFSTRNKSEIEKRSGAQPLQNKILQQNGPSLEQIQRIANGASNYNRNRTWKTNHFKSDNDPSHGYTQKGTTLRELATETKTCDKDDKNGRQFPTNLEKRGRGQPYKHRRPSNNKNIRETTFGPKAGVKEQFRAKSEDAAPNLASTFTVESVTNAFLGLSTPSKSTKQPASNQPNLVTIKSNTTQYPVPKPRTKSIFATSSASVKISGNQVHPVSSNEQPNQAHSAAVSLPESESRTSLEKPKASKVLGLPSPVSKFPRRPQHSMKSVKLPISLCKDELIDNIKQTQFLIVIGEAGCGKSTQIPQYLLDANLHDKKVIGITQPRRLAATSLANRVAAERRVRLGDEVGYAVRFDKKVSNKTVIKYMTDGTLVRECMAGPMLEKYSIIIIDEAHERHQDTDLCLGLLKIVAEKRADLRVIICSATLNKEKFQTYFNNAPVFSIPPANKFRIDTKYLEQDYDDEEDCFEEITDKILEINTRCSKGVILVFLSGQEEIEELQGILIRKLSILRNEGSPKKMLICPCFANLPNDEQQKIFQRTSEDVQKVVLATNIAETSLTIDGVKFVIDTGYFKQNKYDPDTGISCLMKQPVTKSQATQRQGRAGRTVSGECFRMYTTDAFKGMDDTVLPEMNRSNLDGVVLSLLSMKINPMPKTSPTAVGFDYIDPPDKKSVYKSILHLNQLGATKENSELSPMGQRMAQLPIAPQLSRSILESEGLGCLEQVVIISSLLSAQCKNIFLRNNGRHPTAAKAPFINPEEGDLITLLNIYNGWIASGRNDEWCKSHFIQPKILREAHEIKKQLDHILSLSRGPAQIHVCPMETLFENVHRSFTAGYFRHAAKKREGREVYQTCIVLSKSADVHLCHDSVLIDEKPDWLIFNEIMTTKKTFIREAFPVELSWIQDYAEDHAIDLDKLFEK